MSTSPFPKSSDDLNAFVDGALAGADRSELNDRLTASLELRQELAELQATATLLGQLPELGPRRTFTLGPEFARTTPAPGKILRFLPIVRSLSVAAVLVFMVVAGSLFFDIHGDTDGDAGIAFQAQNAILDEGGTETDSDASDDAEDAPDADAPATAETASEEASKDDESSMTSRGDAASIGDDPIESAASLEQSDDSSGQAAEITEFETAAPGVLSSDDDRTSWIWTSVVVGGLALVLSGLWFVLAQAGRQSRAGKF